MLDCATGIVIANVTQYTVGLHSSPMADVWSTSLDRGILTLNNAFLLRKVYRQSDISRF